MNQTKALKFVMKKLRECKLSSFGFTGDDMIDFVFFLQWFDKEIKKMEEPKVVPPEKIQPISAKKQSAKKKTSKKR